MSGFAQRERVLYQIATRRAITGIPQDGQTFHITRRQVTPALIHMWIALVVGAMQQLLSPPIDEAIGLGASLRRHETEIEYPGVQESLAVMIHSTFERCGGVRRQYDRSTRLEESFELVEP